MATGHVCTKTPACRLLAKPFDFQKPSQVRTWSLKEKNKEIPKPELQSGAVYLPTLASGFLSPIFRFNRFAFDYCCSTPGCKAQPITCYVFSGFYLFAPLPVSRMFRFYRASINTHFPLWFQFFLSFWWWLCPSVWFIFFYVRQHPRPVTWRRAVVLLFCSSQSRNWLFGFSNNYWDNCNFWSARNQ